MTFDSPPKMSEMTDSYDITEVNELVLYDGGDADAQMKWYVHLFRLFYIEDHTSRTYLCYATRFNQRRLQ